MARGCCGHQRAQTAFHREGTGSGRPWGLQGCAGRSRLHTREAEPQGGALAQAWAFGTVPAFHVSCSGGDRTRPSGGPGLCQVRAAVPPSRGLPGLLLPHS